MSCGPVIGSKILETTRFSLLPHRERRVLVTLDKDFGELAIVHERPHSGILRIVGFAARQHAGMCQRALDVHGSELATGAIVTVERGRLRIRE